MKAFGKAIFIYTLLVSLMALVFSFVMSFLLMVFRIADLVAYGGTPSLGLDPDDMSGVVRSIMAKIAVLIVLFICMLLFLKLLLALGFAVGTGAKGLLGSVGKMTSSMLKAGAPSSLKDPNTLKGLMNKLENPRNLRKLGKIAGRNGLRKTSRGLHRLSDGMELSNLLSNDGALRNTGKLSEEDAKKDEKNSDKRDEKNSEKNSENAKETAKDKDGKEIPQDERERRSEERKKQEARGEKSEEERKSEEKREEEEKKKTETESKTRENTSDYQDAAEAAGVPGAADMADDINVTKEVQDIKNLDYNGTIPVDDSFLVPMGGTQLDDVASGGNIPNVDQEVLGDAMSEKRDELKSVTDGSAGFADDGSDPSAVREGTVAHDPSTGEAESGITNPVEQSGEVFSRSQTPLYGTVAPAEVLDSPQAPSETQIAQAASGTFANNVADQPVTVTGVSQPNPMPINTVPENQIGNIASQIDQVSSDNGARFAEGISAAVAAAAISAAVSSGVRDGIDNADFGDHGDTSGDRPVDIDRDGRDDVRGFGGTSKVTLSDETIARLNSFAQPTSGGGGNKEMSPVERSRAESSAINSFGSDLEESGVEGSEKEAYLDAFQRALRKRAIDAERKDSENMGRASHTQRNTGKL